ncbi:MAG: hypothetical protein ACRC6D_01890 [Aeromonas sp.]
MNPVIVTSDSVRGSGEWVVGSGTGEPVPIGLTRAHSPLPNPYSQRLSMGSSAGEPVDRNQ